VKVRKKSNLPQRRERTRGGSARRENIELENKKKILGGPGGRKTEKKEKILRSSNRNNGLSERSEQDDQGRA